MVTLEGVGYDESLLCNNGPGQLCSWVPEQDQRRRLLLEPEEETGNCQGQAVLPWIARPRLEQGCFSLRSLITRAHPAHLLAPPPPTHTPGLSEGGARGGRLQSCHLPADNYYSRRSLQEGTLVRLGKRFELET